jgi:hypothetical protein
MSVTGLNGFGTGRDDEAQPEQDGWRCGVIFEVPGTPGKIFRRCQSTGNPDWEMA